VHPLQQLKQPLGERGVGHHLRSLLVHQQGVQLEEAVEHQPAGQHQAAGQHQPAGQQVFYVAIFTLVLHITHSLTHPLHAEWHIRL